MAEYVSESLRGYCKASNMAFNEKIKEMRKNGEEVCHLAFGQSPFPIPSVFVEELKNYAHVNDYLTVAGDVAFRKAIAAFHAREDGLAVDESSVVVGPGSKELIYLTMRIFEGDILLPDSCWTTYAPQSHLAGHNYIKVETSFDTRWLITPEELEKAVKRESRQKNRLLILTFPGNPSGTSYTENELLALKEVCQRNNIVVLSDEIYGKLNYEENHVCMAKVYPEKTILSTGFSKWASAGGWRVGYMVLPDSFKEAFGAALVSAASHTYSCAPAPMQFALAKGLEKHEELHLYMAKSVKVLSTLMKFCVKELRSVGVRVQPGQGGYYIMPDFEVCKPGLAKVGVTKVLDFCELLLKEERVSLMRGDAFLRPSTEFTTRFCFVDFDGRKAFEALEELMARKGTADPKEVELDEQFIETYAKNVFEGVNRIKRFVNKYKD